MTEAAPAERRVKLYDFRRPDKFSRDQIRTVAIMHEVFARQTTTALSAMLRSLGHVHVASVDQLTYEEFIRSIPNPTTIAVVGMAPLKGSAVLEIDPAVAFAIIDRIFGGQGEGEIPSRELTDIEASAVEGVIGRLLGNLREAWSTVIDLRPRLEQIETNPMFVQVVPPSEMVVLVTLRARIGAAEGMINFCIPYLTIEPVVPKLSARRIFSFPRRNGSDPRGNPLLDHICGFPIPAEVILAGTRCSLRELGALKKGSRLPLPASARRQALLRMGGRGVLALGIQPHGYSVLEARGKPAESVVTGRTSGVEPTEADRNTRQAFDELKDRIDGGFTTLSDRVADLQRRQAAMADELAFPQPGQESVPPASSPPHRGPFDFIRRADSSHFLGIIQREHPQLIALVLAYLDPHKASSVLGGLPPELQPEVARRVATMEQVSPHVLREVAGVLERKLSVLAADDLSMAGGVESLVEILSMADRSTEKRVMEALEGRDASLADIVKRSMFVFEDIVVLDHDAVVKVIQRVDPVEVLRAMKAAPPEVQQFLWDRLPAADVEGLKRRYEALGRLRLSEVEKAQAKIVALIREMDENGEIVVPRPGETIG